MGFLSKKPGVKPMAHPCRALAQSSRGGPSPCNKRRFGQGAANHGHVAWPRGGNDAQGEHSGRLEELLRKCAQYIEEGTSHCVKMLQFTFFALLIPAVLTAVIRRGRHRCIQGASKSVCAMRFAPIPVHLL